MPMTSCCCCLNLRQGTLGSAIFTFALSTLAFIGGGLILSSVQQGEVRTIVYVSFGLYGFWLLMAALMIVAVKMGNRWLLMPWMIYTSIMMGFMAVNVIMMIPQIGAVFANASLALQFCVGVATILGNLYCLVCVVSYFKALKEGGGTDTTAAADGGPKNYTIFHNEV